MFPATPSVQVKIEPHSSPMSNCPIDDCSLLVDTVVQSSDDLSFGSHLKNIQVFNDAFPISEGSSSTVKLSETSQVVRLLLRFSHNAPLPDLLQVDFSIVLELLEATRKYENRIAMQACNTAIHILARKSHRNSLHLLKYKVLRDESKDIGRLVHRSMDLPLSEALFFLKDAPEVYFVYTQYREAWKSYWENYDRTTEDLFALIERSSKPGVKDFAEQAQQYDRYTNDGNPPSVAAMLDKVEEMHGGFKARFGKSSYSTSREYTDWVKAVESQYPRWEDFSSVGIRSPPR